MNQANLDRIIDLYIDKFEFINDKDHYEYYKWNICYLFRELMDEALKCPIEEFSSKLMSVRLCTVNIVDSYIQSFYGLVKLAEIEPEFIRQMFIDLYQDDGGDLDVRMSKISTFIDRSNEILDKYYPESFLYKQNSHSVSSYLFLYDPDNHYMFKASECNSMADCIGFYDSWGSGDNINLKNFYRMCDEILNRINSNQVLLKTNDSRYDPELNLYDGKMHPDTNKHILLYDIIYCSQFYNLYSNVTYEKRNAKEKRLLVERENEIKSLQEEILELQKEQAFLDEAIDYFSSAVKVGDTVEHFKLGEGIVTYIDKRYINVKYESVDQEKEYSLITVISKEFITYPISDFEDKLSQYQDVLLSVDSIYSRLNYKTRALDKLVGEN